MFNQSGQKVTSQVNVGQRFNQQKQEVSLQIEIENKNKQMAIDFLNDALAYDDIDSVKAFIKCAVNILEE